MDIKTVTLGEPMLEHDLSTGQIRFIQSGLHIPNQAAAKRMARMIRVLMGDKAPDTV